MTIQKNLTSDTVREILNIILNSTEDDLTREELTGRFNKTEIQLARGFDYSDKQLGRIFQKHSNLSLMKYRDRIRLASASKYIMSGNKMKDAAIKYGYTEQGLSNAFKNEYGLNIRDLQKGYTNIDLYKDLEISDGVKRTGEYTFEFDRGIFGECLTAFEEIDFIDSVSGESENINDLDSVIMTMNLDKLLNYINNIIGKQILIPRHMAEQIFATNTKSLLILLIKEASESTHITIELSELVRRLNIIMLFYNIYNPIVTDTHYIYTVDPRLNIIIDLLKELKDITGEEIGFDFSVLLEDRKSNIITVTICDMYKYFFENIYKG